MRLLQLSELSRKSWYVGNVARDSAEATVRARGYDGAFVVRQSQKGGVSNPLTLTLLYANNVYNLHIRLRPDDKFAIGKEKSDEIVSSLYSDKQQTADKQQTSDFDIRLYFH